MSFKGIEQYWSSHLLLIIGLTIFSGVVLYSLGNAITTIPRSSIPFLATVQSTLLGLTFTAFAIISAFMPSLRRDYVETNTFLNIGRTFVGTLFIQFFSLIMSFFTYLSFPFLDMKTLLFATVTGTIFSFGFLGLLIWQMFMLFRIARNSIVRKA